MEAIWDSAIYVNKEEGQVPGPYYLVAWKEYLEEENTWEPSSAIQHLKKPINFFYKKHSEKQTATFLSIDYILPMARPIVKPSGPTTKWKRGQPVNSVNSVNKQAKN